MELKFPGKKPVATDILKKRMQRGVWFEAHSLQIVKLSLTLNIYYIGYSLVLLDSRFAIKTTSGRRWGGGGGGRDYSFQSL